MWVSTDDEWRVERRETFAYNPKMWVIVGGDVKAQGSKDFVDTVDTDDGEKEVHYSAADGIEGASPAESD